MNCFLPRELKFSVANSTDGTIVECNHVKPILSYIKTWAKNGDEIEVLQATKEVKAYFVQVYDKYKGNIR